MSDQTLPRYRCNICAASFSGRKRRILHRNTHPQCDLCHHRFIGLEILQSHQKENGHCFCGECELHFSRVTDHVEHARAIQHTTQYKCCDCDREYASQQILDNHCCDCDKAFRTRRAMERHFKSHKAHVPRVSVPRVSVPQAQPDNTGHPHKCKKCDKMFANRKALKSHAKKHKPPRHIPCPVGATCVKKFATPSALLRHMESGRCAAGMTREKLNGLVFAHDHDRHITSAEVVEVTSDLTQEPPSQSSPSIFSPNSSDSRRHHLLTDESIVPHPTVDDAASEWSLLERLSENSEVDSDWSLVSGIHTPASIPMSDIASNDSLQSIDQPHNLRCPLCPPTRKPFYSPADFQRHLSSTAHAPKIFHCPLAFVVNILPSDSRKKEKCFSTLSGLTQHLESGACRGGTATYRGAMKYVEEQLMGFGLGDVKLLLD